MHHFIQFLSLHHLQTVPIAEAVWQWRERHCILGIAYDASRSGVHRGQDFTGLGERSRLSK